jgi:hypothetical protein
MNGPHRIKRGLSRKCLASSMTNCFAACTTITLGDGHKASFWSLGWLQGRRPKDIAPLLFWKIQEKESDGGGGPSWQCLDTGPRPSNGLHKCTSLTIGHAMEPSARHNFATGPGGRITWTQTPHGEYTAASAYIAQFNGCVAAPDVAIIWKTCPPGVNSSLGWSFRTRFFYGTQYDLYDRLKKDLYVIEKDLYIRIRRLRLILYGWFF